MKKPLRRIAYAIVAILVGLVALLLLPSIMDSREQRQMSLALSDAISGARSVTLIEFSRRYYKLDDKDEHPPELIQQEVVLNRVIADPAQIKALRAATSSYLVLSGNEIVIRGCYNPHHRIEIVKRDGSTGVFEICFDCQRFTFDRWYQTNLPKSWIDPLRAAFSRVGLPPKKDGEYINLATERMNPQTP